MALPPKIFLPSAASESKPRTLRKILGDSPVLYSFLYSFYQLAPDLWIQPNSKADVFLGKGNGLAEHPANLCHMTDFSFPITYNSI